MKILPYFIIILCISLFNCSGDETIKDATPGEKTLYFPPINSNTWETTSALSAGWNDHSIQPLLDYLEDKNSKSFIMLYAGKIVIEAYFNDHSATKPWYWASAGKTLTSAVAGIAETEGYININNKVSDYLGTGWTSATLAQEDQITCKHLLNMTSGLDDSYGDDVSAENLFYKADAGTRWAYHNVYVKLQDVVSEATSSSWTDYFNSSLRDKIGMTGSWVNLNNLSVYYSNTKSMARFGLLAYHKGKWGDTQIIPESFFNDAINTSQSINKAYGYLWWLNGKSSFHLPQTQLQFSGTLIPNAPSDMYAALGKNDQKIYVVPSKKLVVIRMGDAADGDNFALSNFDNELWAKINAVIN